MDQYIVRLIHTFNLSGATHTGYHGPYASVGEASDAADALEDHYRTWPMYVNGRECHTAARVEALMPPPRPLVTLTGLVSAVST